MPELSESPDPLSITSRPGVQQWLETPQAHYVRDWIFEQTDPLVSDIFGFYALQLGFPAWPLLRQSRIKACITLDEPTPPWASPAPHLVAGLDQLPIDSESTDLVLSPLLLSFQSDPHQALREMERILIPEGHLILIGFNPMSLWGLRNLVRPAPTFPWNSRYLSAARIRDWLKLLNFEVDRTEFGCFFLPCQNLSWLRRSQKLETIGTRAWPVAGALYFIHAIKRKQGMHLIKPKWRQQLIASPALRPVARKESNGQ